MSFKTFKWTDLWTDANFSPHDSIFFSKYLEDHGFQYQPQATDPDLILCSVFSKHHQQYDCPKLLWSGENFKRWYGTLSPSLNVDWIFTTNTPTAGNQYYLPYFNVEYDITRDLTSKNRYKPKRKFCAFVYSNKNSGDQGVDYRMEFFKRLNQYRTVDAAGPCLNNMNGWMISRDLATYDKWISQYKFVVCMENTWDSGYCTEKIGRALCHGCVPIYVGDPDVARMFNTECLVWDANNDMDNLIQEVAQLDQNYELYQKKLLAPILSTTVQESMLNRNRARQHIQQIVDELS